MESGKTTKLTWPQFQQSSQRLLQLSSSHNDDWLYRIIKDEAGYSFLEKRTIDRVADKGCVSIATESGGGRGIAAVEDMEEDDEEEAKTQCVDTQCFKADKDDHDTISRIYHVVYSHSYNVPVLYFNMHHSDGRLLSLEEVWQQVPNEYQSELYSNRWGAITQQEHPLLGQPYFWIHPCQTESLMAQIELSDPKNYIISWLSMFGPLVGLNIPISYANFKDLESNPNINTAILLAYSI